MKTPIPIDIFSRELRTILAESVGTDYASYIAADERFALDVKQDVEETSAWADEGYYNDDDIRLAIGRVLSDSLGIEH